MAARKNKGVKVEITFTPGYERRFTAAVLKIYEKRELSKGKEEKAS